MATRKARVAFTITRFRNLMSQIRQSKRGILGITIIVFFVMLAILAPLIAPYDAISPYREPGQYPGYGVNGPKIAEKLSYPSWYKQMPWIYKGPIEAKESFRNTIIKVGNQIFSNVTALPLVNRVAEPLRVTAVFPNESSRELIPNKEWTWNPAKLRLINLDWRTAQFLPNGTRVEVNYLTGADITDTMALVTDYKFSSDETFHSTWETQTSHPELLNVKYNNQKGFKNDGCVEITYSGSNYNLLDGLVNTTLLLPFEYPYWATPMSFDTHFSVRLEASGEAKVTIKLWLRNEALERSSLIAEHHLTQKDAYLSYVGVSSSNETITNVGSYPERIIFPKPANMSFALSVDFPNKDKDVTVYIDNVQCILFGNSFGLLGTDNGSPYPPRDIFSTLVYGTRVSLMVGVLSAVLSTVIGLFLGLISGYVGGAPDETIMRFADLLMVLPTLPLFIVLIAVMKSTYGLVSMWNIIILITFFGWMGFSRSVRSMVLSIRERPYIEAAKAAGGGRFYIITKHMIPNVFPLVYITLATAVPGAIITEASLSWLGLGDPSIPSWGKVLYDFNVSGIAVTKGLTEYWFWIFPPCLAIAFLATAFILLGFALDEILNPRLRERR